MTDNLIPVTPSAYSYPLLIKNLFLAPAIDNPDQEIVYRDSKRFTYREFRKRVHKLANTLAELGVKPGDTVAVLDWDSHRYLECYYAVPMLGAVLHMVNIRLSPDQIAYTINHAEDAFLLINDEFLPVIEQIHNQFETVKGMILLTDEESCATSSLTFLGEYEKLLAAASDYHEFADFDENTRATTFYTTGTTGMPKGVYFSHRQLVLHTLGVTVALASPERQGRFHQGDVYMPITPMFHVHAWGLPFVATSLGVKQVYPGKYAPQMLLQLIATEGVTFSHCVPTILHMLMNNPAFETTDLSRWKVIIGGAALPKKLCRLALAKKIDIFSGYGMSETCPILSLAQTGDAELSEDEEVEIRCKTGRPIPMVQLKVINDKKEDVTRDGSAVGEIVVRAPWLTQGYFKDSYSSEILWEDGYLHTGDVSTFNSNNYIAITDRMKDVIKVGGEWLSSLELEDAINLHPAVSEVAVIGIHDDKWSERPLALIVLKSQEDKPDPKEIISHVRSIIDQGQLSKLALLLNVRFVDTIDKTSVGKIDKKLLRNKHLAE